MERERVAVLRGMGPLGRRVAALEAVVLPSPTEGAAPPRVFERLGRAGDLDRLWAGHRAGGLRVLSTEAPEVTRAVWDEVPPGFGPIAGAPRD